MQHTPQSQPQSQSLQDLVDQLNERKTATEEGNAPKLSDNVIERLNKKILARMEQGEKDI